MIDVKHLTRSELEAALEHIRQSPKDGGRIEMICRRPAVDQRELLDEAMLDFVEGVLGDNWRTKGSNSTPDGSSSPEAQVTLMNTRVIALVAQDRSRWELAGDQIYLDMDLSLANLPPGTRLRIGTGELEVSAKPHTGCSKFVKRFGIDAMKFVNSPLGRQLNLRGINAKVVTPGVVRVGDQATKAEVPANSSVQSV